MKKAILLFIILILVAAPSTLAQDGGTPPDFSQLGEMVAALAAAVAALLGAAIVEWFKRLPFFTNDEKTRLSGPAAQFASLLITVVSGYLVAWLTQSLGALDNDMVSTLVVTFGAAFLAEVRYRAVKAGSPSAKGPK